MNSPKNTLVGVDSQIDQNLLQAGRILRASIKLEDLDATIPRRLLKPNYSLKKYEEAEEILEEARWWSIPFLVVKGLSGLKTSYIGVGSHSDMVHIILIGGAHAVLNNSSSAPSEVLNLARLISGCASADRSAPMLSKALIGPPQKSLATLFESLLADNTKITGKLFDRLLGPVRNENLSGFYIPQKERTNRLDESPTMKAKAHTDNTAIAVQLAEKSSRSIATSQLAKAWRDQIGRLKQNFQERSEKFNIPGTPCEVI